MESENTPWYFDPLSLLGLLQGILIWLAMVLLLTPEVAWISFACGGLIGFFIWLTALGYQNSRVAKFTIIGILLNAILSSYSAWLAFG